MRPVIIGARRWLVIGTLLVGGATFGGIALHGWIVAPSPCVDVVERVPFYGDWSFKCASPKRLTVEQFGGQSAARCSCPLPDSDADSPEERECIVACGKAGMNRSRYTPGTGVCSCLPALTSRGDIAPSLTGDVTVKPGGFLKSTGGTLEFTR